MVYFIYLFYDFFKYELKDNSEFGRNGDTNPTRLWAQRDAANYIIRYKSRENPENECGIVSMSKHIGECESS